MANIWIKKDSRVKPRKVNLVQNLTLLGKLSLCTLLVAITYGFRIPMAYQSFWAEDGDVHLYHALKNQFPVEIFQDNYGGYWNVTSRLIARVVILFPIELFSYVNFFLICAVTGLVIFVVYDATTRVIQSRFLRILLSASIPMLPIARFDVIATSVNLHYYLLFALLLVLVSTSKTNEFKFHHIITIVLATLSDPLTIFCMIVLTPSFNLKTKKFNVRRYSKSEKLFLLLAVIHSAFTALRLPEQLSIRQPDADHSIIKAGYLFLDRVLGSTFIPGWGEVSSNDFNGQNISSKLILRSLIGISLFLVLLSTTIYVKVLSSRANLQQPSRIMFYLLVSGISYWVFSGIVFNPEPRYAVYTGLCLLTIIIAQIDQISRIKKHSFVIPIFSFLLILTWFFSWTPSEFRTNGVTWKSQLADAKNFCENKKEATFDFVVLPYNWDLPIACSKIMNR